MTVIVHGYAIVSADDRIADAEGRMPQSLQNEADWAYFQAQLDLAALVVLGRASHEATPNARSRRRVVISSRSDGLERRPDAWWWNPARMKWDKAAALLLPEGGRVGVPGGQGAFDLFLPRFAAFHLARARQAVLPGGRGLFSRIERGARAEDILQAAGLVAGPEQIIDAAADVTLRLFTRRA